MAASKNFIVYATPDGNGMGIIMPTGTTGDAMKDVPQGCRFKVIAASNIPTDREFRDAWRLAGSSIAVDIAAARDIKTASLRAQRQPLLDALDVQFQQAQETGADTTAIVAEKNRLRTITDGVAACETVDELKAITV